METHVSSGNSDGEHRQAQEKVSKTETSVQIREIATNQLLSEIRTLIESSRKQAAQAVNTALVLLYWRIGRRIHIEIIGEGRAEYGERVVETLSKSLAQEYGKGFSRRNLFRMIRFAEIFPDEQIVPTLSAQLSSSHFLEIIPLRDLLQRGFYAEMCRVERWSVRTLRAKIRGMLVRSHCYLTQARTTSATGTRYVACRRPDDTRFSLSRSLRARLPGAS